MRRHLVLATAAAAVMGLLASPAPAAPPTDTTALQDAVTVSGMVEHLEAFQSFADTSDVENTRLAGSTGYDDSAAYVADRAEAAGYDVTVQEFVFTGYRPLGPSTLRQTAPGSITYVEGTDYQLMSQTEPGNVTAAVTAVDLALGLGNASSSGCESSDFAGFPAGNIALIQRGTCTFQAKAENAAAAGAVAAIIFNQGDTEDRKGLIGGTLSAGFDGGIPVMDATYDRGQEWATTPGLEMQLIADVERGPVTTSNVLADTPGGRADRVVVVGAHLDSVPEGPGIQDNGSGSAMILEIAEEMAELGIEPQNKVRFAWWGAEESGLIGSDHYVSTLPKSQRKNIALNLNFDMVASPNYVRFIYDGDGSAFGIKGPSGSGHIEQIFQDWFDDEGLATEPTAFDGRSDYDPFITVGIPAGGLFTGAEGIKTVEEAAIYGGTPGEQYDPCYHEACDDITNITAAGKEVLGQNGDAAAHAVLTFAMTSSSVSGTAKASPKSTQNRGHQAIA